VNNGETVTTQNIFPQNTIAIVWDFDKTLIPYYMQKPLFEHFDVDEGRFWDEVNHLPEFFNENGLDLVSQDTIYLNHMLTYVRHRLFKGLNNQLLRELGNQIEFYDGLPNFFRTVKNRIQHDPRFSAFQVQIEHYVISSGLRQMVLGSKLAPFIDGTWACEFVEAMPRPGYLQDAQITLVDDMKEIVEIGYVIDNTTKTRALFEINKGVNKDHTIDVNAKVADADRRVPFENMIYIADGPSDIPVFSMLNQNGGRTYAVYKPNSQKEFNQANQLQRQGRVNSFGEADYTEGSKTFMWILNAVEEIAFRIVQERKVALSERLGQPPKHL